MKKMIIGSSGKIGKYFLDQKNFIFTYYSKKIKGGIKFNLLNDSLDNIIDKNKVSQVVILSSYSDPDFCKKYLKMSRLLNVKKTKEIIDSLISRNIYFIFFSTEFVYDGKKGNYTENDKTDPVNIYGKQKIEIEKYIQKKTKKFCIFRVAKTYGDNFKEKTLITDFLIKCKSGQEIYAASDQIFSPLYIKDLVRITLFFLKKEIKGIYNLGGGTSFTRYELYNKFNNLLSNNKSKYKLGKIIKTKMSNFKFFERRPNNVSLDTNKIQKVINFKLSDIERIFKNIAKC